MTWKEWVAFDELVALMTRAEAVICHAGVGTIVTALKAGHVPVVIPRLAAHGEHVDDHQMDIATKFGDRGLLRCVTGDAKLEQFLSPRSEGTDAIGSGSKSLRDAVLQGISARR